MWRSYNEDWERRKSYLIRSLFHDVPLLSPVPEESNLSDGLSWSPRNNRAPSPLPQLIIEKEPNRHDEPEEYYKVLELKIRRIYQKLFIEGRDLSDSDYWVDDYDIAIGGGHGNNTTYNLENSNTINEDITENNVISNPDTHYQDNSKKKEVNNDHTANDSERNDENSAINDLEQDIEMNHINYECSAGSTSGYIADSESTEDVPESSIVKNTTTGQDRTINQEPIFESIVHKNGSTGRNEAAIGLQEIANVEINPNYLVNVNRTNGRNEIIEVENNNSKDRCNVEMGNDITSIDITSCPDSVDQSDFRQITTEVQVHVDPSEDVPEKISVVYEESLKSVILVSKQCHEKCKSKVAVREDFEMMVQLEEIRDPVAEGELSKDTHEDSEQFQEIEVMRHIAKISTDSIVVTRRTDSSNINELTSHNIINSKFDHSEEYNLELNNEVDLESNELQDKTPGSQNGKDFENLQLNNTYLVDVINQDTENDVTLIDFDVNNTEREQRERVQEREGKSLKSVLEFDQNYIDADQRDSLNKNKSESLNSESRKRKTVESTAVQTGVTEKRFNWENLAGNFFVGAPKIFRLCSCNQHICY